VGRKKREEGRLSERPPLLPILRADVVKAGAGAFVRIWFVGRIHVRKGKEEKTGGGGDRFSGQALGSLRVLGRYKTPWDRKLNMRVGKRKKKKEKKKKTTEVGKPRQHFWP